MPSFDVVSEVDQHELTNAVDQAQKEIQNRYDFKGTSANAEIADSAIVLTADSDFQIQQMHPIVYTKLSARGIDIMCLDAGKVESSGKGVKQRMSVKEGIDKETAKKAVAKLKESKMKVQAQIQGCLLYTSPSPRDRTRSRMPSSA